MALITVFTCDVCGFSGHVDSDPQVWRQGPCPQEGCDGNMTISALTGTY